MASFTLSDRSTFKYWFAHLCAYNMTALNLKAWKFKYLFHDIEKPFLKLFLPYEKVQKIHRINNKHHLAYKNKDKIDWEALIIDWECSRFTKKEAPLTAREEYEDKLTKSDSETVELMRKNIPPILKKFNL